jgi:hypothetical protein
MEEIKTKICSKCGIEKDINEFYLISNSGDGRHRSSCKECHYCCTKKQRKRNTKEIVLKNMYLNTLEEVKKNNYLNCLKEKIERNIKERKNEKDHFPYLGGKELEALFWASLNLKDVAKDNTMIDVIDEEKKIGISLKTIAGNNTFKLCEMGKLNQSLFHNSTNEEKLKSVLDIHNNRIDIASEKYNLNSNSFIIHGVFRGLSRTSNKNKEKIYIYEFPIHRLNYEENGFLDKVSFKNKRSFTIKYNDNISYIYGYCDNTLYLRFNKLYNRLYDFKVNFESNKFEKNIPIVKCPKKILKNNDNVLDKEQYSMPLRKEDYEFVNRFINKEGNIKEKQTLLMNKMINIWAKNIGDTIV